MFASIRSRIHNYTEMYPECVILDAENIEWRVPLDAEKHDTQIFVSWNNFYQQIDSSVTVYFAVNFQTKAEKSLCFLITFLSR